MTTSIDLSERASNTQKTIGRSIAINGVHAVDVEMKQAENLNDPLVDINLKLNNPVGRLWLALKRIWKSQSTIISLKFTIPLLVLPIALYVLYVLWQGRGVAIPMTKLGAVHSVVMAGNPQDVLILPSSDVYVISYSSDFDQNTRIADKPIIATGTYHVGNNTLDVETLIPYNPADLPSTTVVTSTKSVWDDIWDFISQFH